MATEQKGKTTVASWKKRKAHEVTLPSGAVVTIAIPNLPLLMKTGRIPNHLVSAASGAVESPEATLESLNEQVELTAVLVSVTLVEPALDAAAAKALIESDELPYEDVEMVAEFALRARDMDAAGKQMGGIELAQSFPGLR